MSQSASSSNSTFSDSLEFVKKLWGGMNVPGMGGMGGMGGVSGMPSMPSMPTMAMPSMSLEDIDKRIQDLKTVETWLNLNMTMLRNTIQALEIQRATIATLHSLSSTMSQSMQNMNAAASQNPFSASFNAAKEAAAASAEATQPEEESDADNEPEAPIGDISPLIHQSAAWWQGVQEQFKQALGTALEKSTASYEATKAAMSTPDTFNPQSTSVPSKPAKKPADKMSAATKAAKVTKATKVSKAAQPVKKSIKKPSVSKTVRKTKTSAPSTGLSAAISSAATTLNKP